MFNPEEAKYANGVLIELPYSTDDVRLMTKAAMEAVERVYLPGFKYSKAEVLLVNLCQKGEYTEDLFSVSQPEATEKVMGVLDAINGRWGRGTMRLARSGLGHALGNDEPELYYQSRSALDGVLKVRRVSSPIAQWSVMPHEKCKLILFVDFLQVRPYAPPQH